MLEAEPIDLPRPGAGRGAGPARGGRAQLHRHLSPLGPLQAAAAGRRSAARRREWSRRSARASTDFREGDRVGYFTGPPGAYATHRTIARRQAGQAARFDRAEQAAAAMLKGCTAEYLIERCARVEAGADRAGPCRGRRRRIDPGALAQGDRRDRDRPCRRSAEGRIAAAARRRPCFVLPDGRARRGGARADRRPRRPVSCSTASARRAGRRRSASVARRGLIVTYGNASGPVPPFTALDLLDRRLDLRHPADPRRLLRDARGDAGLGRAPVRDDRQRRGRGRDRRALPACARPPTPTARSRRGRRPVRPC